MDRRFIIIGIGLIVVGKVFLAEGLLSQDALQKCLSIDRGLILGPTNKVQICTDDSMKFFILSIIFLAAGAGTFVYGWKSKAWMKKYT